MNNYFYNFESLKDYNNPIKLIYSKYIIKSKKNSNLLIVNLLCEIW